MPRQPSAQQIGFTLIELMITIAVLGVVISLAAPSFRALLASNRAYSASMDISSALMHARSEAVRRATRITVCKSSDTGNASPTCNSGTTWGSGWLIFVDGATAGTVDGTDTRLKVGQPNIGNGSISSTDTNFANYISFDSRGAVVPVGGATSTTFSVCIEGVKRDIQIAPAGRIHTSPGTC